MSYRWPRLVMIAACAGAILLWGEADPGAAQEPNPLSPVSVPPSPLRPPAATAPVFNSLSDSNTSQAISDSPPAGSQIQTDPPADQPHSFPPRPLPAAEQYPPTAQGRLQPQQPAPIQPSSQHLAPNQQPAPVEPPARINVPAKITPPPAPTTASESPPIRQPDNFFEQRYASNQTTALVDTNRTLSDEPVSGSNTDSQTTMLTDSSSTPTGKAPLPLAPPSQNFSSDGEGAKAPSTSGAITTALGSLAVVVGLFLLVAWFARRSMPAAAQALPSEVIEVLGRAPLAGRQTMQMIRVGRKIILLCVTPNGAETLTEITDREEVDRIAGLCQQQRGDSISNTFRQVFAQLADDPTAGATDPGAETSNSRSSTRRARSSRPGPARGATS